MARKNTQIGWRRLVTGLAFLAGLAGALSPTAAFAGPKPIGGVRLLTYNTAFMTIRLSGLAGDIDTNDGTWNGLDYTQRANKIADGILRGDNDVVVLNEVFSDVAKNVLETRLKGAFPFYIKRIEGPWVFSPEALEPVVHAFLFGLFPFAEFIVGKPLPNDSGLMVFSRLPFLPFVGGSPHHDVNVVEGWNGGLPWGATGNQVSVSAFTASAGFDGLASKAIAMLRLNGPNGIFNVAFTHLQADYYEDNDLHPDVRDKQFNAIRRLITDTMTTKQLTIEPVYLMGDLNVVGENRNPDPNAPPSGSEWAARFDPKGAKSKFFACGDGACTFNKDTKPKGSFMTDSWGRETSPLDNGMSNYIDRARLDYILHSKPLDFAVCMQHVAIAYELGEDNGNVQYSDHLGVRADFNKPWPHCSPNEAAGVNGPLPIEFTTGPVQFAGGDLHFPGTMQWYEITDAGSYSFGTSRQDVGFDVYADEDLSTPIVPFQQVSDAVTEYPASEFVLPAPPYFIRVYGRNPVTRAADRTVTGKFEIEFHQHRGLDKKDAIGLLPGGTQEYLWPIANGNAFKPDQKVWFKFFTDVASSGKFPHVSFMYGTTPGIPAKAMKIRVVKDVPNDPTMPGVIKPVVDGLPIDYKNWPQLELHAKNLPGTGSGPKKYFVQMQRKLAYANEEMSTVLEFHTDLTYFRTHRITVEEEYTYGPAGDDITAEWAVDVLPAPTQCANAPCNFVELNDNDIWQPQSSIFHKSYVKSLVPTLWDSFGTDDQVILRPQYFFKDPSVDTIKPLSRGHFGVKEDTFIWSDKDGAFPPDDEEGYWYEMRSWRAHDPAALASHHEGK